MPPSQVDEMQRGRQGGADHGGREHERQQPERDPAASARRPRHVAGEGLRQSIKAELAIRPELAGGAVVSDRPDGDP